MGENRHQNQGETQVEVGSGHGNRNGNENVGKRGGNRKTSGRVKLYAAFSVMVLLLAAILCACDLEGPPADPDLHEVIRVVDGDTIVADIAGTEEKVRLIGVDTPESVHPDSKKNTEYGKIASEYTKSMLEGKFVSLEYDVQERDRYGRILAYVYVDGEMLNKMLLFEGHAVVATYPPNVKYTDDFVELQKTAREQKKGLWAESAIETELPVSYVGNRNSKVYHISTCGSVSTIKEENRIDFDNKAGAESEGYRPCKRCNP